MNDKTRSTGAPVVRPCPLICTAAQLVRGEFMPRSGRISAREVARLEEAHRVAGLAIRHERDRLHARIRELEASNV